ncbi:MAG: formyltransferase family protein [Gammaproteobacteria bacterium]|jgi:methionyl-tRNA formyltransferase
MKIAFMGNPGYGGLILEALCSSNAEVVAVFHASHSRVHRLRRVYRRYARNPKRLAAGFSRLNEKFGQMRDEPYPLPSFGKDVLQLAQARDLPLFDGSFVHHPDCPERLRSLGVEVILVASFSEFLPQRVIDVPTLAAINMHPALLPRYRGWCPEFSAVLNGESRTGISYHLMEKTFDTGNVLLQRSLEIQVAETTLSLKNRLAQLAIEAIPDLIALIANDNLKGLQQDQALASYCRLEKNFNLIDESKSVKQIRQLINACCDGGMLGRPYFSHNGHKLSVLSHGHDGWRFEASDGAIEFDVIRYKHRTYQGDDLRKLRDTLGASLMANEILPIDRR